MWPKVCTIFFQPKSSVNLANRHSHHMEVTSGSSGQPLPDGLSGSLQPLNVSTFLFDGSNQHQHLVTNPPHHPLGPHQVWPLTQLYSVSNQANSKSWFSQTHNPGLCLLYIQSTVSRA